MRHFNKCVSISISLDSLSQMEAFCYSVKAVDTHPI